MGVGRDPGQSSLIHVAADELEAAEEGGEQAAADTEDKGGGEAAVEEEVHG